MKKYLPVNKDIVIGVVDIEITGAGFGADKAQLFSFGSMLYGQPKTLKVITLPLDFPAAFKKDHFNDKPIVEAMVKFFDSVDVVVAHFGSKFDIPFIRAKMMEHDLVPIREPWIVDTCIIARKRLKLSRNSLDNIIEFLNIEHKKTHFNVRIWRKAEHGDIESAQMIHDHCAIDVLALDKVVEKMWAVIWEMPVSYIVAEGEVNCPRPKCKGQLTGAGNRRTKTKEHLRYKCLRCAQYCRTENKTWSY